MEDSRLANITRRSDDEMGEGTLLAVFGVRNFSDLCAPRHKYQRPCARRKSGRNQYAPSAASAMGLVDLEMVLYRREGFKPPVIHVETHAEGFEIHAR